VVGRNEPGTFISRENISMLDLNVKIHVAAPTFTLNCYTVRWCLILRFHHEIFPASLLILGRTAVYLASRNSGTRGWSELGQG